MAIVRIDPTLGWERIASNVGRGSSVEYGTPDLGFRSGIRTFSVWVSRHPITALVKTVTKGRRGWLCFFSQYQWAFHCSSIYSIPSSHNLIIVDKQGQIIGIAYFLSSLRLKVSNSFLDRLILAIENTAACCFGKPQHSLISFTYGYTRPKTKCSIPFHQMILHLPTYIDLAIGQQGSTRVRDRRVSLQVACMESSQIWMLTPAPYSHWLTGQRWDLIGWDWKRGWVLGQQP